ncbi:MAG: hypothetical protein U1E59_16270 [Amaricoccus sp.]
MSSNRFRKPEYRLRLGYPEVVLEREGCAAPLATAVPEPGGYAACLDEIAAAVVPAGAPLTIVLPEPAVWRGRVDLPPGTRAARQRAARAAAAPHLGVPAEAVVVTLGTPTRTGTPVAAVAHATLDDTHALVAAAGLKPASVVGSGDFPGFAAVPRLAGAWRPTRPARHAAAALGAGTIVALAALLVTQTLPQRTPVTAPVVAPAAAQVAAVAEADATALAAPPAPPQPASHPTVRRAEVHPVARPVLAAPPPARPALSLAPVPVTMGTRNVTVVLPPDGGAPEVVLPPIPHVSSPIPRPRPAAASAQAALRPLPRPGSTGPGNARPEPEAPVSAAGERPLPRPAAGGVRVASLEPAAGVASLAAQPSEAAPPPRPAGLHFKAAAMHAKPKVVTGTAPRKTVAAKPQPTRPAASAPQRVVTVRKAPPQPVPATAPKPVPSAAPIRVASVAPLAVVPVRTPAPTVRVSPAQQYPARPVQAAATPARSTTPSSPRAVAAATQRGVAQRGGVTLIGIFGTGAGRHALLKMPNGRIQRVTAGDQVSGMQIAAVGSDSVQVNNRGRATILSLPD